MMVWLPTYYDDSIRFLLIVRERVRPGSEDAYNANEVQIAAACARLQCPHPYLALAPVAGPGEVWWLNAFVSAEERDGLDAAYARNEPLMAALKPLGTRKEEFRDRLTSTMTEYRRDVSGGVLRIAGARFLVVSTSQEEQQPDGAVFESTGGERFVIAPSNSHAAAEHLATRFGPGAIVLAVQPQWSVPAEAWIDADPDFWNANPVARNRGAL
jgi:hypothetical protein